MLKQGFNADGLQANIWHKDFISVSDGDENDDDALTKEEEWIRRVQVIREEKPLHHVWVHVGGRGSPRIIWEKCNKEIKGSDSENVTLYFMYFKRLEAGGNF